MSDQATTTTTTTMQEPDDIERLELYLDRELPAGDVLTLEARLANDAALRGELDRLRGQRSRRLAAMSIAFDTDAAAVERLVASVRIAQADEARTRRRSMASWFRPAMSAAACVAFGLVLGTVLHRQQSTTSGTHSSPGLIASPSANTSTGGMFVDYPSPQGNYVVILRNHEGNEVMRVRFPTQEAAQAFIQQTNARPNNVPDLDVGNAKLRDTPTPY